VAPTGPPFPTLAVTATAPNDGTPMPSSPHRAPTPSARALRAGTALATATALALPVSLAATPREGRRGPAGTGSAGCRSREAG
jgi:hypothetical protein